MKDSDNNLWCEEPCSGTPGSTSPSLLDGVRAGDEESRERLVSLYLPLVYHRYLAKVPKDERADIIQQVFATVFQKVDGFEKRFDGPAFRGWLYRIAFYKVGGYIKRKKKEHKKAGSLNGTDILGPRREGGGGGTDGPRDSARHEEKSALVRRVWESVKAEFEPDTFEAARQLVIEGRCADVVAAALGKSKNAVYVAKSRVLKRVRCVLTELGECEKK